MFSTSAGEARLVRYPARSRSSASTATTGGLANPILSTFEAGASFLLAVFAILLPVVTMVVVVAVVYYCAKKLFGWLGRRQEA